jgi:hypothetical protein
MGEASGEINQILWDIKDGHLNDAVALQKQRQ